MKDKDKDKSKTKDETKDERRHALKKAAAEREQRRQTVAANLLAGLNYRSIAEGLSISIGTVSNDVKIIMNRWRKEQLEAASEIAQLEIVRLDRALFAIWSEVQDGDIKAIQSMLKIMERRAKLLGLDAPTQGTVEVAWQEKLPPGLDPELLKRKLATILVDDIKREEEGNDSPD